MKQYRPLLLQKSGLSKLHTLLDDASISRRIKIQIQKITNLFKVSKSLKTSRKLKQKTKRYLQKKPVFGKLNRDRSFTPRGKGKGFITITQISDW